MITIVAKGGPELEAAFKSLDGQLRKDLKETLTGIGRDVAGYIGSSLLSGQMLKIRSRPDNMLRAGMRWKLFERADSIRVDVFPKSNSPLWMLGAGMAARQITVRKGMTKAQRQVLSWTGTEFRQKKKMRLNRAAMGTYQRMHHLHKVPFMETAFNQWKAECQNRMETSIGKSVSTYGP